MSPSVRRLNWGCGPCAAPGWINADRRGECGVDLVSDIREGLPLDTDSLDYAVAIHVFQDLPYGDVLPALKELQRVLKPRAVLRLAVPDLDRALAAYLRNDHQYFYVKDDDATCIGAKLITQLVWYGSVRTPCTYGFVEEWLHKAAFTTVARCAFKETRSPFPDIVSLDNRQRESLFVEAVK